MARRSPMNQRYQKNTAPAGKTRKSAAAAKPKRRAAADAGTTPKKSSSKAAGGSKSALAVNPPTPEFRFWRRVWWGLLIASFVLAGSTYFLYREPGFQKLGQYGLFVSYVFIGAALFLDLTKLRRMRQEWIESGGDAGKSAKPQKSEESGDMDTGKSGEAGEPDDGSES